MGISRPRAQQHVEVYLEHLKKFPQTANWPKYLFHAAQVEVAAEILKSRVLVPRAEQRNLIHDVANQAAIASNPNALNYARLYFRPKNSFHLKTEGIKCIGDPYRDERHMSVPIMLAFDSVSVLTREDVGFAIGKLAHAYAEPEFGEAYFDTIPFDDVYHDHAPQSRGDEIRNLRMSEVVCKGQLPLEHMLGRIVCRTAYDRATLLYLLGDQADVFRAITAVEQIHGSVFLHKGIYLSKLNFEQDALSFRLHSPARPPSCGSFQICIRQQAAARVYKAEFQQECLQLEMRVVGFDSDPQAIWRIEIEGVLAYFGRIASTTSELV